MSNTTQKRSKIFIIILSVILAIIAAGAIAISFMLNYNTFSPDKPVVLDDGQNIYISTTMNDNYKGYRFKFIDENDKEIIIDSKNNQISVNELLEKQIVLGKTYKVSICYLAENVGNNSEYSNAISWKCQNYLSAPVVEYNEETSVLSWQDVVGADFYRIYISGEEQYIETIENSYDLKSVEGGVKSLNVVSYSNDENYLTSNKSNTVNFTLIHYLEPFTSIDFNAETKVITAKSNSNYTKIDIYLDGRVVEANAFQFEKSGEEYIYTIDITTIYNGEESIGIAPSDIDEYNVYEGVIIYYTPENLEVTPEE